MSSLPACLVTGFIAASYAGVMNKRTLGKTGLQVSAIGCWRRARSSTSAVPFSLEENIGAASVDLTDADLREINDAASKITVQGARLPEAVLRLTNG